MHMRCVNRNVEQPVDHETNIPVRVQDQPPNASVWKLPLVPEARESFGN